MEGRSSAVDASLANFWARDEYVVRLTFHSCEKGHYDNGFGDELATEHKEQRPKEFLVARVHRINTQNQDPCDIGASESVVGVPGGKV